MAKKGGLGKGMEALLGTKTGSKGSDHSAKKLVAEEKTKKENINTEKSKVENAKDESKKEISDNTTKSDHTEVKVSASKSKAGPKKSGENTKKTGGERKNSTTKNTGDNRKNSTTKNTGDDRKNNTAKKTGTAAENKGGENRENVQFLPIQKVEPNRDQPRKKFDEAALSELSESIKNYGVLQPLLVQEEKDYYRIIAGERRWRAAKLAGLKEVPVIIRKLEEKEILEISLIENLQREDLNPIEEALGYQRLIREFGLTQEDLANRLSKSRPAIANIMRLLKLEESVQDLLSDGRISAGHARALLALEDLSVQKELAERIIREGLSVRETERLVKNRTAPLPSGKVPMPSADDFIYRDIEEKMRLILGTKVEIKNRKKRGKIEIEYYSPDELNRILEMLQTIE